MDVKNTINNSDSASRNPSKSTDEQQQTVAMASARQAVTTISLNMSNNQDALLHTAQLSSVTTMSTISLEKGTRRGRGTRSYGRRGSSESTG
ncbi:unnamed protein product [Didymodactylos carnosus]|uniref:Uncharacterized protein n=1 Tax=Didymodactylos carnosus TaxID=1234261 RepID=A0A815VQR9_9BILA|nr:unnamed protein product [Didymodactylos carnosus]CAF1538297.1 unnamed protein product [Didymodactylos carnosus]CAF3752380.1 unnamed protein product [Didymodactylos carnosus]CAF4398316.1 unnamed protein product [Didymodactylos carnosus]